MTQLSARTWVAATVVVAVLLLVASWFLVIGPVRADAASLRDERVGAEAQNAALTARTEELRQQFANLPDEQRRLDALQAALPSDVALPTLLRDLSRYSDQSGLTLMSVTPGTAVAVVDPAAAPPGADAAGAPVEGDAVAEPAEGDAAAAPDAGVPADPTAPPASPGSGVTSVPVTITVIGEFFDAQDFLRLLQTEMPRAFLVRTLSVTAEDAGEAAGGRPTTMAGDVTLTVTADVFARPSTLEPDAADLLLIPAPPATTPGATTPGATTPGAVPPADPGLSGPDLSTPAPIAPEGPGLTGPPPPAGDPQTSQPGPAGEPDPSPSDLT